MAKLETRRVNPIAHITFAGVVVLIVFEALVIFGVFELQAQTVAKYAPWVYEPFLRLVGEHPDSVPRQAAVEEVNESEPTVLPEANATGSEPTPVVAPTNAPVAEPEEIVPVG